jgi:hypothetical protein
MLLAAPGRADAARVPAWTVASVARLVSVFVGAEVNVTLMFGYFASKIFGHCCPH